MPVRVARLAGSPGQALRTLAVAALLPALGSALRARGATLRVRVAGAGGRYDFHVDDLADLHVLNEVWHARVYDGAAAGAPAFVLDVGANIGASVAFFKDRWPGCAVHGFEPDPRTFAKLRRNVGGLPGVTLHRAAIGAEDGEVTLWSSPAGWESSVLGPPRPGARPVVARQHSLASALEASGAPATVDLVKLDVEGAEFAILPQVAAEPRVHALVCELHFDLVPAAGVDGTLAPFADFEVEVRGDERRRIELRARRRP